METSITALSKTGIMYSIRNYFVHLYPKYHCVIIFGENNE
jgi:hypothetical protein